MGHSGPWLVWGILRNQQVREIRDKFHLHEGGRFCGSGLKDTFWAGEKQQGSVWWVKLPSLSSKHLVLNGLQRLFSVLFGKRNVCGSRREDLRSLLVASADATSRNHSPLRICLVWNDTGFLDLSSLRCKLARLFLPFWKRERNILSHSQRKSHTVQGGGRGAGIGLPLGTQSFPLRMCSDVDATSYQT